MIYIYGLKNCDTCRKALKAIDNAILIDVRENPLDSDLLDRALAQFGEALVNTRSTTWRGLTDDQRAKSPMNLLKEHAALMKRPLIDKGGKLFLGWTKQSQTEVLGS